MRVIYNIFLPARGFSAIMLFGVIFARREYRPLPAATIRHEEIHRAQAKDMRGYISYYISYLYWHVRRGYEKNPFEIEARHGAGRSDYLEAREKLAHRKFK